MTEQAPVHLCVTHSPLVTQVFQAAASLLGLPDLAIRYIARRATPFPGVGLCLDDVSDELERCFKKIDVCGYRKAQKRLEEALLSLTGGQAFTAYIPHLNKIIYQEIIHHPQCACYAFLEEGFTSMLWENRRNARSSWFKKLRSHLRTFRTGANYRFTRPMFDHSLPHYRAAYVISKYAFRGIPGRIDVSAHLPPVPAGTPPGKTYLILDASYLHQNVSWEDYENAMADAVSRSALPTSDLLVKFHFAELNPHQKLESFNQCLAVSGFQPAQLLPNHFSIEQNLTRQDLLLFATTSLGYYTALSEGHVICFAGHIKGLSVSEWIADGSLPPDFPEIVGIANS